MPRFLTFDLGTTLYKVALFDDAGRMLGLERVAPPIGRPRPGWAEVDADAFLRVLCDATVRLKAQTGGDGDWRDVAALSFATQANSFTLLDDRGDATMPFILWSDERAMELSDELAAIASQPNFRATTGTPRFGPYLALAKVLWLRRSRPDALTDARAFCYLSDFLSAHLTQRAPVAEAGVAGLSGALDARTLQWRDDVLSRVGADALRMPPVARAGTDLGPVAAGPARAFGLPPACRVVLGCLDQYAGAIGTGTTAPGAVCETTGTVLAAVRCSAGWGDGLPDDVFQGPSFDADRVWQMSFSSTSANLLEWYRNALPDRPSFDELSRLAAEATDAAPVEPYEDGKPIEGCFRHVMPAHTRGQVVRGIMERVATALASQVRSLCGHDLPPHVRSAGGAARSDAWLRIKRDRLGVPFRPVTCEEPTSLGAAMLAASTCGVGTLDDLAHRWVTLRPPPDAAP